MKSNLDATTEERKNINVRIRKSDKEFLQEQAMLEERSLQSIVSILIHDYVEKEREKINNAGV